jgi:CRP-like cAMP-binding protein
MAEVSSVASQSCLLCKSRASGILADLDEASLKEIEQMRQARVYPAGAVVFGEGDPPEGIYCIRSGCLKLSLPTPHGAAVIVKIATAGGVVGVAAVLSSKVRNLTAETLEQSQLGFIHKQDLLSLLRRNADLSLALARGLADELYEVYQAAGNIALRRSDERLAHLLLRLCQSHGEATPEGIRLRTSLSQEELAEMIGASRRSLVRSLAKLRSLGIVECHRRTVIVRDRDALEKALLSGNLF